MTDLEKDGIVEFRFYRPGAKEVNLVGEFNAWRQDEPMQSEGNGWWVSRVPLAPGEYRFRYVSDGVWYTDFASHGVEISKMGWNSVLVVPDRAGAQPAAARPAAGRQSNDTQLLVA